VRIAPLTIVRRTLDGKGALVGSYAEREQLMDAMERWNDAARATVPAERLLVWHAKQGFIGGAVTSIQQWWDREQAAVA
jgi:hypothetical protein